MSQEDYVRAYKMGKKNYDTRMMLGQRATLEVLDEILPERHDYSEEQFVRGQLYADIERKYGICGQMVHA